MRYSEIMNLKWDSVDISEQVIKLSTSKNGKPRHLPLKGKAFDLVVKMSMQRKQVSEFLFPAPNNPMTPYDIRSAWNVAVKRAEVKNFHFHDIRHTTASHLTMSGKGLHDVASLLGHKDLQSSKRYSHLSSEYKSKMVEDLNEIFFGVS
jgi:integrase